MNRQVSQNAIQGGHIDVYIDGGDTNRLHLDPNGAGTVNTGRNRITVHVRVIILEDETPDLADALHKLAEQAERSTRLADNLRQEQGRVREATRMYEVALSDHEKEAEAWRDRLAFMQADRDAIIAECDQAKTLLADRTALADALGQASHSIANVLEYTRHMEHYYNNSSLYNTSNLPPFSWEKSEQAMSNAARIMERRLTSWWKRRKG